MNKQEFVEKLESLERDSFNENYNEGYDQAVRDCLIAAKQLDEPKKVVVPKFVAEWIKYAKEKGYGFMQSYDPVYLAYIAEDLDKWIDDNEETFAHAWLVGYEVEKEQLYYVKLPGVGYLNNADGGIKHTEQEIKTIDERYWLYFTKKVEG